MSCWCPRAFRPQSAVNNDDNTTSPQGEGRMAAAVRKTGRREIEIQWVSSLSLTPGAILHFRVCQFFGGAARETEEWGGQRRHKDFLTVLPARGSVLTSSVSSPWVGMLFPGGEVSGWERCRYNTVQALHRLFGGTSTCQHNSALAPVLVRRLVEVGDVVRGGPHASGECQGARWQGL